MFDPVRERSSSLRAHLVVSPIVVTFHFLHEETAGDIGYFRVRCILLDGSELELAERFTYTRGGPVIDKYSYHWQGHDGALICRWDNAPHHREVATFPHHQHVGNDDNVQPHLPLDAFAVLDEIGRRLESR